MNKIQIWIILLLALANIANAQDFQSIKTKETSTVDGKTVFVHTVLKGQTIYGISKAYQVAIEEIEALNPGLKDGLKIGMVLYIPKKTSEVNPESHSGYFLFHSIEEGETLYALSKKYNVKIEDIIKNNPDNTSILSKNTILKIPLGTNYYKINYDSAQFLLHLTAKSQTIYSISNIYEIKSRQLIKANPHLKKQDLKTGELIFIPKSKSKVDLEQTTFSDDEYFYHIVEKKQTLYSLSNIYRIKIEDIKTTNPFLNQRSLLEGDTLKIPKITNVKAEHVEKENIEIQDTIIKPLNDCIETEQEADKTYKIAILLPFYANISDTLDNSLRLMVEEEKNKQRNKNIPLRIFSKSEPYVQAYLGMLSAVENLKKQKINIELFVHDTENDSIKTKQILSGSELKNMDLIIANVTNNNQNLFYKYTEQNQVHVVSPFSSHDAILKNNPWVIQTNPTIKSQASHMVDFLINQNTKKMYVISDSVDENNFYSSFKNMLAERDTNLRITEIIIQRNEDTIDYSVFDSLGINALLIHSEDQAFVTDMISKIYRISPYFKFMLLGRPRWIKYDNIEIELFHQLNTWLFTPSMIHYEQKEVESFVKNYRLSFKMEPDRFAFQGFDVMRFFIGYLQKYGKAFCPCLGKSDIQMLSSPVYFKPFETAGGYENQAMYLIHYDEDFQIKIIKEYPEN